MKSTSMIVNQILAIVAVASMVTTRLRANATMVIPAIYAKLKSMNAIRIRANLGDIAKTSSVAIIAVAKLVPPVLIAR